MPNIAKLIDKSSSRFAATAEVSTIHQHEQMKCALCKFIGSIATRKNPIVLFLDGKILFTSQTQIHVMLYAKPHINFDALS